MSQEIDSPPYPGEGSNGDVLLGHLKKLRKWVVTQREAMNETVGQEVVPDVREIPDKRAYTSQPVATQYEHLLVLRRLREEWDHLIRCYEDDWNCKTCVRAQAVLMQSAAVLLNTAFTPYEVREMEAHRNTERMHRTYERVREFCRKFMEPEEHDSQPYENSR
jgi:hypothetical protein